MELWQRLNSASESDARAMLHRACGSTRWVDRMVARRPFPSREVLLKIARDEWLALTPDDWREAFSHHPRIGERSQSAGTRQLSEREQAGVASASSDVRQQLAEANAAYETRFGFIFIVCATGKSAQEMLDLLRARIGNDPNTEVRIAAEEQAKITALRLQANL